MHHCIPDTLLSDRGNEFLNDFHDAVCRVFNIKHIKTSSGHPQSDGQNERWHRELNAGLRAIARQAGLDFNTRMEARWDAFLANIAASHNRKKSRHIGMAPDKYYFSREIDTKAKFLDDEKYSEGGKYLRRVLNEWIDQQAELIDALAKANLAKYDATRKAYFDRLVRERRFEIGDTVKYYIKSLGNQPKFEKLEGKWHGPVTVVEIFNDGYNYVLSDGTKTNVHKLLKWNERGDYDWEQMASEVESKADSDTTADVNHNPNAHAAELEQLRRQNAELQRRLNEMMTNVQRREFHHQPLPDFQLRHPAGSSRRSQQHHDTVRRNPNAFERIVRRREEAAADHRAAGAGSSDDRTHPLRAVREDRSRSRPEQKLGAHSLRRHDRGLRKMVLSSDMSARSRSRRERRYAGPSLPSRITDVSLDSAVSHAEPGITAADLEFNERIREHQEFMAMSIEPDSSMNL